MVVANGCMHWEEGIVELESQLTDAMDANKTLSSTTTELTREKDRLVDKLTRLGAEALAKDKELKRMAESYNVCIFGHASYACIFGRPNMAGTQIFYPNCLEP